MTQETIDKSIRIWAAISGVLNLGLFVLNIAEHQWWNSTVNFAGFTISTAATFALLHAGNRYRAASAEYVRAMEIYELAQKLFAKGGQE